MTFPIGFLPALGQQVFREAYGPIEPETWQIARFLAIYVNLIVLVSAHGMGHIQDVREAEWELENILATEPLGFYHRYGSRKKE